MDKVSTLTAYLEPMHGRSVEVLVRDDALLEQQAFWMVHLNSCLRDLGLVHHAFPEGREQLRPFVRTFLDRETWPYFPVAWSGGRFFVIYRGDPLFDHGLDYVVEDPTGTRSLTLCALEQSAIGPGLSWAELTTVAAEGVEAGGLHWARRFLLLLPIAGDVAASDVQGAISRAVRLVGADGDVPGISAALLASVLGQDSPNWRPTRWTTEPDGLVSCDDPRSRRNPGSGLVDQADARWVSQLLHPGAR